MEYRRLGRSRVLVSPLCLGTIDFGGNISEENSFAIMQIAVDGGKRTYYRPIFERKKIKRSSVTGDKGFGWMGDELNEIGGTRYRIIKACEDSLQRYRLNIST